jgi:hypothetical protein
MSTQQTIGLIQHGLSDQDFLQTPLNKLIGASSPPLNDIFSECISTQVGLENYFLKQASARLKSLKEHENSEERVKSLKRGFDACIRLAKHHGASTVAIKELIDEARKI